MILKKIYLALLVTFGIAFSTHAAPIINQNAADLAPGSYTASGIWAGDTPESGFNGGQWNAGNYGWHWMQADMGAIVDITALKILIAQSPNGVTEHLVYLSDTFIGNGYEALTPIFSRSGYSTHGTLLDIVFPVAHSGRFLQIVAHGGPSWTALGERDARIDWVQPVLDPAGNGNGVSVPEPGIVGLLGLALVGMGYTRRRKITS